MQNFYPNGDSQAGFLGVGEKLEEVIAMDRQTLDRIGISANELGEKLKVLLDHIGSQKSGSIENVDFSSMTWRGMQQCPFENCVHHKGMSCSHSNQDYTLTNTTTQASVRVPGLIWHLIKDHEFFEGKGSSYRVEPEELQKVLYEA